VPWYVLRSSEYTSTDLDPPCALCLWHVVCSSGNLRSSGPEGRVVVLQDNVFPLPSTKNGFSSFCRYIIRITQYNIVANR
jgi:hypothetical protein